MPPTNTLRPPSYILNVWSLILGKYLMFPYELLCYLLFWKIEAVSVVTTEVGHIAMNTLLCIYKYFYLYKG